MIFWLYTIDFLGKLCTFSTIGLILSLVVIVMSLVAWMIEGEYRPWKFVKNKMWIPCVMGLILIVTPDQKTMYLMLSSRVMSSVMASDKVSGIGQKSLKLLEQKLDEMLKEK